MALLATVDVGEEALAHHLTLATEAGRSLGERLVTALDEIVDVHGVEHQRIGVATELLEQALLGGGELTGRLHRATLLVVYGTLSHPRRMMAT